MSASPVVAIGVDASDKAAAEAKSPRELIRVFEQAKLENAGR
jgi:hypothetical protein